MKFLRPVNCCTLVGRITNNNKIQELEIFILEYKIKEFNINWCNYLERMQQNYKSRGQQSEGHVITK